MEKRRIAIYLGSRKPLAKVQMNHKYTKQLDAIIFKQGVLKTEVARLLLMNSFDTNDWGELKERIFYAAGVDESELQKANISIKRRIADVCKRGLKMAIDRGYLL